MAANYSYGGQVENTNAPQFQGPGSMYDSMASYIMNQLNTINGSTAWLDEIKGMRPNGFLASMPFSQNDIMGYVGNQLTGKGVDAQVNQYRDLGLGQVNRAFTDIYNQDRATAAGSGGRNSSFQAAREAKGRAALGGARADVESNAMKYGDVLRTEKFNRGMGVLGALEGAYRGDQQAMNAYGNLLIQSMYPQLNAMNMGMQGAMGLMGQDVNQQQMQNMFNQYLYESIKRGGIGAQNRGGFTNLLGTAAGMFIPGMNIPGMADMAGGNDIVPIGNNPMRFDWSNYSMNGMPGTGGDSGFIMPWKIGGN